MIGGTWLSGLSASSLFWINIGWIAVVKVPNPYLLSALAASGVSFGAGMIAIEKSDDYKL